MAWPPAEFAAYMAKATAAMGELKDGTRAHPHGKALAYRFASQLKAGTATPVEGCPSKACRRSFDGLGSWCTAHTVAQLRAHIETAEDAEFLRRIGAAQRLHNWVLRWVGWRRRRGDLVVMRVKRRTWAGMRTQ